jgi:hypothetical protein
MKTASISSLRVAHELRQAAESVLQEGETLSSVYSSRSGLARRGEIKWRVFSSTEVYAELARMLAEAEARQGG